ncbi:pirin family protein [Planctomycetota bacterium]
MNTQTMGTLTIRKAEDRGHADHSWLNSRHSFSFANYYDPKHLGFHSLRVINDDRVAPGKGFDTHPHQDMEIISYVVEGELEHKDSLSNGSIIHPHDVQRMSAGTGVQHSEFNPQQDKAVHFLQIWITPAQKGDQPSYEQKAFPIEEKLNRLRLVVSPNGEEGSVSIGQDAKVYATVLEAEQKIRHALDPNRHLWVQIVQGEVTVNSQILKTGDGVAIENTDSLTLAGIDDSELMVFDLG